MIIYIYIHIYYVNYCLVYYLNCCTILYCIVLQENILYDQMTKELLSAPAGKEQSLAELKFQTHITEYRERAVHHAAQVQREVRIVPTVGTVGRDCYRAYYMLLYTAGTAMLYVYDVSVLYF